MSAINGSLRGSAYSNNSRWREDHYEKHLNRLKDVKPRLDNGPTKPHPHLLQRRKLIQSRDNRYSEIDRENHLLEKRMENIYYGKGTKGLNTFNESFYEPRINHKFETRQRQYAKTHAENVLLEQRLWNMKPYYRVDEWEKDFQRHQKILRLHSTMTNGYVPSPRSQRSSYYSETPRSNSSPRK